MADRRGTLCGDGGISTFGAAARPAQSGPLGRGPGHVVGPRASCAPAFGPWSRAPQKLVAASADSRCPSWARSGGPVGFLDPVGAEDSVPLYAGLHPIVGDQFLTTNQWELVHLGYVDIALLGFLIPVAPLTGRLWSKLPQLPWASRYGSTVQSGLDTSAGEPAGAMLHPTSSQRPVTLPFLIQGWAVAPAGVSTVEVAVDGPDCRPRAYRGGSTSGWRSQPLPDTPVSRFEFKLLPSHLPLALPGPFTSSARSATWTVHGGAVRVVIDVAQPREPRRRRLGVSGLGAADRMHWRPARARGPARRGGQALVFTHDLGYGGAQLYLVELLERLMGLQRLTATVVAPSDGPLRERMESLGSKST